MPIRTEQIDVSFNLKLQKDLQEHEIICSHCGGTGLQVDDNPFGIKEENSKVHFPYKQQTIRGCNHCYNGVQSKCLHCGKILDRSASQCNCDEARWEREGELWKKDLEVWNKSKKISYEQALKDYTMVYIDNYDKYLSPEEIEEYLEEHDYIHKSDLWIYGTQSLELSIDSSDILENACSDLHEGAMDNISAQDEEKLQVLLDQWCEENSSGTTTYYVDYKIGIKL